MLELLFILGSLMALALALRKWRSLPLPPALKGHPLLGHLLMLPTSNEHLFYQDVSKQLDSDIISFTVLGQVIVILNSIESATDLLLRRGSIYSDRPQLPMLNDEKLVGYGQMTTFLSYGERWKKQRAMTQAALNPSDEDGLWLIIVKQTRLSAQRLLLNEEGVLNELRWMTAATMLSSIYGYEPSYPQDDLVKLVETALNQLCEAAIPSNFYVNTLPWLINMPSWFPGTRWKRMAKEWRVEKDKLVNDPFEWTKSQMRSGIASTSVTKESITRLATSGLPEPQVKEAEEMLRWVTATLYAAGADTTVSTETAFILAMILHPEVQKKAQAELDTVLGDRLPELSDQEAMPYLNAVMKEVMRWHPPAPMSVPRATAKEDVYRNCLIPKGAIVSMNVWAISNCPSTYPDPHKFNPDRFLDPAVPSAPVFGLGRRNCPGAHLAQSSFFMMASTFLALFNITSTSGKPFPEHRSSSNVLVSHLDPFNCTVTARSEGRQRLIEQWVDF